MQTDFSFLLLSAIVSVQFLMICALAKEQIARDKLCDRLSAQISMNLKELRSFQIDVNSHLNDLQTESKLLREHHEQLKESQGKNPPVYLASPENRIDGA